jgi:hypothetical protein
VAGEKVALAYLPDLDHLRRLPPAEDTELAAELAVGEAGAVGVEPGWGEESGGVG